MTEIAAERRSRSIYQQFTPGDCLNFTLHTLNPDGSVNTQEQSARIQAVKGGGFFGRVLILENQPFVLKTSVPDPWHDLWRRANWRLRRFPSQVNETQAKLDHLAMNLIHDTISILTEGEFYAPKSLGYTELPGGFAQAIERLSGRGPRYDLGVDEYTEFRDSQVVLTKHALGLGLEQAGQVDPKNPYALANIRLNAQLPVGEWMDTLPAIRHTVFVLPFFYFPFHKGLRKFFYPDVNEITFNRIHTEAFFEEIKRQRDKFPDDLYQRIFKNLMLYETLRNTRLLQTMWEEKGTHSPRDYGGFLRAGKSSLVEFLGRIPSSIGRFAAFPIRMFWDESYRRGIILGGVREAYSNGTISKEELDQAEADFDLFDTGQDAGVKRKLARGLIMGAVWAGYQLESGAMKAVELPIYAHISGINFADKLGETLNGGGPGVILDALGQIDPDAARNVLLAYGGFKVFNGLYKITTSLLAGRIFNMDMKTAAIISAIPIVGDHIAIPIQISVSVRNQLEDELQRNNLIGHYATRQVIANITGLHPAGGWGTQLEGEIWQIPSKARKMRSKIAENAVKFIEELGKSQVPYSYF